jgi:DNA-binding NarL/FixJ family response regulator
MISSCAHVAEDAHFPLRVCRILVADDSDALRKAICALLSQNPDSWQVCGEARDGEEALQKAAELKPDVVFLDARLPVLSGWDVARALQHLYPWISIVMMSLEDPPVLARLTKASGLGHWIAKSRLSSDLVPLISSLSVQSASAEAR